MTPSQSAAPFRIILRYDFWRRNLIVRGNTTEENGRFIVSTKEDHGLVADENTVRELYRPKRTFTGETKFVIHTNQREDSL